MRISCEVQPNIISDRLQDDVIVIDIMSGAYYALTEAGSDAWSRCVDVDAVDVDPLDPMVGLVSCFVDEGLITCDVDLEARADTSSAFTKYIDLSDLLLADPIHEVDSSGWPTLRAKDA